MNPVKTALYSAFAFCTSAVAATSKACNHENIQDAMKRVAESSQLLKHKSFPKEVGNVGNRLEKLIQEDNLFIVACIRKMSGLPPIPSPAERTPVLPDNFLGMKLVSRVNAFDIADSTAEASADKVFKKAIVEEQAPSILETLSTYAEHGISYINTPTGLVVTALVVGGIALGAYNAFCPKTKTD